MQRADQVLPTRKRAKAIKHRSKMGAEPGSLIAHEDLAQTPTTLNIVAYDAQNVVTQVIQNPEDILPFLEKYPITWLQVCGLGDIKVMHKITDIFKLNTLAMEDVVNTHQRSKLEEYDQNFFAISRIPEIIDQQLTLQQLSVFWGDKYVITFQEFPSHCFDYLLTRISLGGKRDRLMHPAFLAYAIFDTVIDCYFPILEEYGGALDALEENAIDNPSAWVIRHIHDVKHDLSALRRSIWSQRNAIGSFKTLVESDKDLWFYLRDCEDHTIQLLDVVESYRDRSSGLMDIYLASVNNRTNKIMKQLTMIATFFMPIGVLAGIFGMNFDRKYPLNMPELSWPYGYIYFWSIVAVFGCVLVSWFYRKGWFKV